jgi:hypothetical protein
VLVLDLTCAGADSLETVRNTHSHYFATSSQELLRRLEQELAKAGNGRRVDWS